MIRQVSSQIAGLVLLTTIFLWNCQSTLAPVQVDADSSARITAAAATSITSDVCDYNVSEAAITGAGWTRIFYDEFSGSYADKWTPWQSGAFNNELQLYTTDPKNLTVTTAGVLNIKAVKETKTGPTHPWDTTPKSFSFTSGRIESKTLFTPTRTNSQVRMMARIKLPTGYGMWPAYWSYGDNWPTNGEIDILEAKGHQDKVYHTNYFYGRRANMNLVQNAVADIYTSTSLMTCWHVYELIWTQNELRFLLDGQVVDVKTGGYVSNLFGKQERITLNLAVGGDYVGNPKVSEINPGTTDGLMQVDWVRVYTKK